MKQLVYCLSFILLLATPVLSAIGPVQSLSPQSAHEMNDPSQESLIEMVWDLPEGYTSVTGYYYIFTDESNFTLDETTTTELNLELINTAYASQDYTGANDVSVYVYVAAVAYDEETYQEGIGETTSFGPIRVDTVAPNNAGVSVEQYINSDTATLSIGGFGNIGDATQMYISNVNYETSNDWETIVASKPWPLEGGEGKKTIYVRFKDDAGNTSDESVFTVYDTTAPTTSIISDTPTETNSDSFPITIIFHDPTDIGVNEISAFGNLSLETASISVTNATLSDLTNISSGNNATAIYQVTVSPQNQGKVSVQVLADAIEDQAGNGNTLSNVLSLTYDTVRPQVTISSPTSANTNQSPLPVTITFSEPVTSFDQTDVQVMNGTINNFTSSGDNIHYTLTVTPIADGTISVNIAASSASDAAGNTSTIAQTFTRSYDSTAPSVTISASIANHSLTEKSPIAFTFVFSETVYEFIQADINIQNASIDDFSGLTQTYHVNVYPIVPLGLTRVSVQVQINAAVATDIAGNDNTVSNAFQLTYTTERPTVSLTSELSSSITPQAIVLTITFNRPVDNFSSAGVTVINGAISNLVGINGDNAYTDIYRCTLTPDSQMDVQVKVKENVAQTSSGYTNTASSTLVYDINDPPDIAVLIPQIETPEDTCSPAIPITIADADNDPLTVTVQGDHIKQYTLVQADPTHLSLTVQPKNNYNGQFTVLLVVTDPYDLSQTTSFSLQVTPVNDAPALTFPTTPMTYTENDAPQQIGPDSVITDIDSPTFDNGRMVVVITENATEHDCLSLISSSSIEITDTTIFHSSVIVATYTESSNHQQITITFNSVCTPVTATAILQHLVYKNTSDHPQTQNRQISVWISDGTDEILAVQPMQVIEVNDMPQILSIDGNDTVTIPHGLTPGATIGSLLGTDIETSEPELTYTFTSGDGDTHNSLFTIQGSVLKIIQQVSYDNHQFFSIRLQVTDSDGGTAEKSFMIFVSEPVSNVVMSIPALNDWTVIVFVMLILLSGLHEMKKKISS